MENREILSYFDILALSKCILYFDILLVFRICNLKFSRIRTEAACLAQLRSAWFGAGRFRPASAKMLSFMVLGALAVQRANVELSMQLASSEGPQSKLCLAHPGVYLDYAYLRHLSYF